MSTLLTARNLGHSVGTKGLFSTLNFSILERDKVGLVGHNGCGKSSLFRLLDGSEMPDEGAINWRRGSRLETVEQFLPDDLSNVRLREAALEPFPAEEREQRTFEADRLLERLGFNETEFQHLVGDLSGGQQNRLMFARAVISEPDIILFDEPTNHLDLATLGLFEQFMRDELRSAFIIVSHDRTFLDAVTQRTLILRDEQLYHFDVPFSAAREALAEHDEDAAESRKTEEQRIKALDASAKRLANWGKTFDNEKFSRRAKSMAKRVERLESEKTFVSRGSGLKLELELEDLRSKRVLKLENFDVRPPADLTEGPCLFHIDELNIRPGERIALLGPNGAGKTTLIRALVEHYRTPSAVLSELDFSPQTSLGYYDQELEEIAAQLTIVDFLRLHCDAGENAIRSGLIHAGFAYVEHTRALDTLSGGERARVLFVKLRLEAPNFLILDEPTNHIDIEGREQLETQLIDSGATLLITSHDRRFIDNVSNRYLAISNGALIELQDPTEFYEGLLRTNNRKQTNGNTGTVSASIDTQSAEDMLERLIDLEQKLSEDLTRKAKHQKLALQKQWREEIESINKRL